MPEPSTPNAGSPSWLRYAIVTTVTWGLWGALSDLPSRHGFPETLTYVVWALTMTLPCLLILRKDGWAIAHDARSVWLGLGVGLSGSAGVILLFPALSLGPAYLIFPLISLAPVVTIALTVTLLQERTGIAGGLGIALALLSLPFLNDWQPGRQSLSLGVWFYLSLAILILWGLQNYLIKLAQRRMSNASVFFYMTLGGLLLIPVALQRTDWSTAPNLGLDGMWLSAGIQLLSAIGSLAIVFALKEGKAIVVAPLTNALSPLITVALVMVVDQEIPGAFKIVGIAMAIAAAALLAIQAE